MADAEFLHQGTTRLSESSSNSSSSSSSSIGKLAAGGAVARASRVPIVPMNGRTDMTKVTESYSLAKAPKAIRKMFNYKRTKQNRNSTAL
jgi:hypothetical protein